MKLSLMGVRILSLFIFSIVLLCNEVKAQIKITFPVDRAIFQRDASNQAVITISGYYTQATDQIEARLVPVLPGQGQETPWTVIQINPQGGVFLGKITGRGGWYSLEVRSLLNKVQVGRDALPRMGIGEVFIIAGQSNAEGIPNYGSVAPTDDRVNTVVYNNRETGTIDDPTALAFTPITAEGIIGPRGRSAWCWGSLGDLLARRLNVPILFMNTGWESTPINQWIDSYYERPVANIFSGTPFPKGMPFNNLKLTSNYYGSILGTRAILWMLGETDNFLQTSRTDYQGRLQFLVNLVALIQSQSVPWVISRTSRIASGTSDEIIAGQNAILASEFRKVFPGPFTDNIQVPRLDGVHFRDGGLIELARAWNASLTTPLFSAAVPVSPQLMPSITVTCNSTNASINLRAPNGFQNYKWSNGQTGQVITVTGAGSYQASMKDQFNNAFLTQTLVINESVQPATPVIAPGGEPQICADSSLALTINTSPINTITWSNGQTGNRIVVNKPGTFTARVTNVFGCASAVSAPVTVKTLAIQPPKVQAIGRYGVEAIADPAIFTLTDTKVAKLSWDWRQDGKERTNSTSSPIKVIQSGAYSARSIVVFEAATGGSSRTCISPFSEVLNYQLPDKDEGLIIYPNPNNSGKLAIETFQDLTNVKITITNLEGKIIFTANVGDLKERKVVDLTELNEGSYVLQLTSSGFNQTKRFIIDY
ncbi:MAG: T9SS C-terminal target domain-containing protein [Cytophagia bacterium]|nr:MAG: T9SS C-terminal target domain-containing protein [Runella sp.]TAG21355.1 MAG: T9SS C-terminal target domain-containing protein [Cytophagales bacterium]TAG40687.1 MAG: T9SS C-terminal target domain-containing protein [Cytophagia bacterium]TAG82064.1 MAG: T9SS C-terminal target domain-containing protein [Cytophagales bacterium]